MIISKVIGILTFFQIITVFASTLINEDFESSYPPEGWSEYLTEQSSDKKIDGFSARISAAGDYLITPKLARPGSLTFQSYSTSADPDIIVEAASALEGPWQSVTAEPFNGTTEVFTERTATLTEFSDVYLKFRKSGAGTLFIDNVVITDRNTVVSFVPLGNIYSVYKKKGTVRNEFLAFQLSADTETILSSLVLSVGGEDNLESTFNLYYSQDTRLDYSDEILKSSIVDNERKLTFSDINHTLPVNDDGYYILGSDLLTADAGKSCQFQIAEGAFSFTTSVDVQTSFPVSSDTYYVTDVFSIRECFSDGSFFIGNVWSGERTGFEMVTPLVDGSNGSLASGVDYGTVLKSKGSLSDQALSTPSEIAFGTWSFWCADGKGWSTSSQNNYYVVLVSDTADPALLKYGSNRNFNGYFLKFDDTFSLYRQTGLSSTLLLDTGFPGTDDTSENSGYSVKVKRAVDGSWQIYVDTGKEGATTLRAEGVSGSTHKSSKYFGVVTKINSPDPDRVVYLDDIDITPASLTNNEFTPVLGMELDAIISNETALINWTVGESVGVSKYIVQYSDDNGQAWYVLDEVKDVSGNSYSIADQGYIVGRKYRVTVVDTFGLSQVFTASESVETELVVTLKKGWNLLSLPWRENPEVFHNWGSSHLWGWKDGKYVKIEEVVPKEGFWFYSDIEEEVTLSGLKRECDKSIKSGWNLLGPLENCRIPEGLTNGYNYNTGKSLYLRILDEAGIMLTGCGYWFWAENEFVW